MRSEESRPAVELLREKLHQRFFGPLMSFFLRRVRDRAFAEDLTQETLTRVLAANGIGQVEQPESYVFKVAINLLRDQRRQAGRHGAKTTFLPLEELEGNAGEEPIVEDLSPERVLLGQDALAEVLQALEELNERTRNIFILFRLENMRHKEIAALYGIAQSTVEKHVMKAVQHLAKRCRRE